jgi:hypothetical protein
VVSFLQVSPPKLCIRQSPPPYAPHAPPISLFRPFEEKIDLKASEFIIINNVIFAMFALQLSYTPYENGAIN